MPHCQKCRNEAVPGIKLCQRHRELQAARSASWNERHGSEMRARQRQRRFEDRAEVMRRLGGRCACCLEAHDAFLTVDHPNNDGAEHRRKLEQGGLFYWNRMLRDWGEFDLRILCWNCHRAISMVGQCPHQRVA